MSQIVKFVLLVSFLDILQASTGSHKLYDFDAPGRAEGIRLACTYSNFDYEDIRLTRPEFHAMKKVHIFVMLQTNKFIAEWRFPFWPVTCAGITEW